MGHMTDGYNESAAPVIGCPAILLVELFLRILRIYTGVL